MKAISTIKTNTNQQTNHKEEAKKGPRAKWSTTKKAQKYDNRQVNTVFQEVQDSKPQILSTTIQNDLNLNQVNLRIVIRQRTTPKMVQR